jgi:hypothetical protein
MTVDWTQVKRGRWLPMGTQGLCMVGHRVCGVMGDIFYTPWVQHDTCTAWYPLGYTQTCLFCGEPVDVRS